MRKMKFYVVWKGHRPGVYDNWDDCNLQIAGFKGAVYKSFSSIDEARNAYGMNPSVVRTQRAPTDNRTVGAKPTNTDALAVDASCLGNPGLMEYRGVYIPTGEEIFRVGPMIDGTNNIGEFLALVHALALLKKKERVMTIYSDSVNAMMWVKNGKCKTKLERKASNKPIFDLIERAEKWLKENTITCPILKWETKAWGEIPADFGRK